MEERTKTVTIISFQKNHYCYVESILLCLKNTNCSFNVISDSDIEKMLNLELLEGLKFNLFKVKSNKSYLDCIHLITTSDLVIFDEPESFRLLTHFLYLTVTNDFKYILTIHEVNSWLFPRLKFHLKPFIKTIIRRLIVKRTHTFSVVGSNVFSFLTGRTDKHIVYIPFCMPNVDLIDNHPTSNSGHLKVIVPGVVSKKRNYNELIEHVIKDKRISDKIDFVFLGCPYDSYGHHIVEKAKSLKNAGYDIIVFDKFIAKDEFDIHMKSADILLSMFKLEYENDEGQIEIYGMTKETGVSFLALSFAKPVILPSDYIPLSEIENQVIPYKSYSDIIDILVNLDEDRSNLKKISNEAVKSLKNFNINLSRKLLTNMLH